jgi:DNA polymerase IIIc chi subunit
MNTPDIIFIKVNDNTKKLFKICQIVRQHFDSEERILFTTPTQEAAQYLDQLLWRLPEEGFLPHNIIVKDSEERIGISTILENLNKADVLFNLCPTASPIFSQFKTVYELYDETHPSKAEQSRIKQAAYPTCRFLD